MSLEEARDIVIIVYAVLGILLFLVMLIVTLAGFLVIRGLVRALRGLLDDPVRPTLEEFRGTAENVRGASEFLTDTAVHPLIRAVSIARGVKRALGVVSRIRPRRR